MRTKIYLAKSNRANPDDVSKIRSILSKYPNDIELVEFKGGKYTHKDLDSCDMLIVLPDLSNFESTNDDRISIGKGLYEQIERFTSRSSNKPLVISIVEENWNSLEEIFDIEVEDSDDYINYATILLDTEEGISEDLDDLIVRKFLKGRKPSVSSLTSNFMYLLIGRD